MSRQRSFTKYENELLPEFRDRINRAESTEDVKKFFIYTVMGLMQKVFGEDVEVVYEDIQLDWKKKPYFTIEQDVRMMEEFKEKWENSDLPQIVKRFAESAANRFKHLQKHPEKTDAKIRM